MPFLRRKSKQLSNQVEAVIKATSRHSEDKNDAQVRKSIAIIGSGVSGLTCAHYLATQFDVT
ncbi:NAD(P)-binding protein, partial [Psychrobacter sp. 16-Bac2893]